jgi:hypothetical protein
MSNVVFIIVELLFLAVTHVFGGPTWTVIGAIAIVAQTLGGVRIASLALMVPSLAWLAISHATGNRELFFPYTMYLASCMAIRGSDRADHAAWLGPFGGAVVVAAFMVIRILQQATIRVLVVEFVVAAAILALVVVARALGRRYAPRVAPVVWHAAIVAASSLLAYASLAI